jgi:UPF0755 protein
MAGRAPARGSGRPTIGAVIGMGWRRDRLGEPDDDGRSWLDQLTGEMPQVQEPAPPDPWAARRRAPGAGAGTGAPPGAGSGVPPGAGEPPGWVGQPAQPVDPFEEILSLAGEPSAEPEDALLSRVEVRRAQRLEQRRSRRRRVRGIVVFLLLLSLVSGVTFQAYRLTAHRPPKVKPGVPVTFTVHQGGSSLEIGRALERAGVVDSAGRFRAVAHERGLDAALKPGTYRLETAMSIDAVIDILVNGPNGANLGPSFTVPEGFTLAQIVDRLVASRRFSKAQTVKALSSPDLDVPFRPKSVKILEGLLFPQTYRIDKEDTPVTVLQQMLDQLQAVTSRYDLRAAPLHLSPYQVLTVASIIEREAKVAQDRPKIARVIYNRLARHQRLQIDATVQYALGTSRRLTGKDLAVRSPYNTYAHEGLPPTPIASPGEDSIRAALQPAAGPWVYYVLISKDGRHAFTDSVGEFARLKAEARRKGLL